MIEIFALPKAYKKLARIKQSLDIENINFIMIMKLDYLGHRHLINKLEYLGNPIHVFQLATYVNKLCLIHSSLKNAPVILLSK